LLHAGELFRVGIDFDLNPGRCLTIMWPVHLLKRRRVFAGRSLRVFASEVAGGPYQFKKRAWSAYSKVLLRPLDGQDVEASSHEDTSSREDTSIFAE
jgi:hypothetical protein